MEKIKRLGSEMPLFQLFKKDKENAAYNNSGGAIAGNHGANDLKIGQPTDFKHNINVTHDKAKNEFIGLPNEWRSLLEKNNIK